MSRDYEMALIVDTQRSSGDVDETVNRYESLVAEHGTVVNVDRWGVRKLAYEIRKQQQGNYTFFLFRADPGAIAAVDRACRLDEAVLRHLILQVVIPVEEEEDDAEELPEEVSDDPQEEEDDE